ncbi:MAG: glycosyltransferase [Candidatus Bathyarchaeia archaeon]
MPLLLPVFSPNFIMYTLGLASHVESMFTKSAEDSSPTIAAIVPAFNEEKSLAKTLESLLQQTRRLSQVIVVDDGSTDRTSEVARKFKDVKVLRNPKTMGKAKSLNRALDLVNTELVMIIDADTVLEKNFAERAAKAFVDEGIAAASGFVVPSTGSANTALRKARVVEDLYAQTTLKRGQSMANGLFVISGCCAVFRTSVLKRLRFSADTVTEDLDLTWALEEGGHRTALIEAYTHTLEPKDLTGYVSQIRRWYMGFFQCLAKHGSRIFSSKPLTLSLALILTECLVFTLFWAAAIGFLIAAPLLSGELAILRGFVLTMLGVDLFTVCFPAALKAHGVGVLKSFLSGLPVYYALRIVNAFVWWTTFVEWLFGLGATWEKTR